MASRPAKNKTTPSSLEIGREKNFCFFSPRKKVKTEKEFNYLLLLNIWHEKRKKKIWKKLRKWGEGIGTLKEKNRKPEKSKTKKILIDKKYFVVLLAFLDHKKISVLAHNNKMT